MPKVGVYKHYKGAFYRVLGVATWEGTEEKFIVYRELSRGLEVGEGPLIVMTLEDFLADVEFREKITPKFQYVSEK